MRQKRSYRIEVEKEGRIQERGIEARGKILCIFCQTHTDGAQVALRCVCVCVCVRECVCERVCESVCECVCVCVSSYHTHSWAPAWHFIRLESKNRPVVFVWASSQQRHTHTHTHTHTHIR